MTRIVYPGDKKSVLYDKCTTCTDNERIVALLDYEER
jgi:hypothetical protein